MAAERSAETRRGGAAETWRRAVAWRELPTLREKLPRLGEKLLRLGEKLPTLRETAKTWRNAETWKERADTQRGAGPSFFIIHYET